MLDPIDHPFITLFITLFITAIVVLGIFFCGTALLYKALGNDNPYNYKYIDVDGNEGNAQWCNSDTVLNCYTNRGYVQVKEFHKNDQ